MRNQRHKLERIDIDELFSSPVNRGMLSFLERPPEEAQARLREKQKVNAIDACRLEPEGELPPRTELQDLAPPSGGNNVQRPNLAPSSNLNSPDSTEGAVASGGNLPSGQTMTAIEHFSIASPTLLDSDSPEIMDPGSLSSVTSKLPPAAATCPVGNLPSDPTGTPEGKLPTGQARGAEGELLVALRYEGYISAASNATYPVGNLPCDELLANPVSTEPDQHVSYPQGRFSTFAENSWPTARPKRPPTHSNSKQKYSVGNLPVGVQPNLYSSRRVLTHIPISGRVTGNPVQPEALDGSVVGRRQKVRRAIVAQDGHSSGEQLLYHALWNAASVETPETRVLSIGYSGMSALCKLEKSNCKKNIQGLIQKLAVEITEPHQSVSSTGTTYRIFSYKEILRRRETAGMVWVVRTSGVRFVNPGGNLPPDPISELRGGAGGESPRAPVGSPVLGGEGSLPRDPVGKTPTQIEKRRNKQEGLLTSASEDIRQLCTFARSQIVEFDDDACRLLWHKCKEVAPDCTVAEVIYCFDLKARQLLNDRVRNVANPVGLMIWSVPKMFEGPEALYLHRRRAKADEAVKAAEAVAQFEQNRADWQALLDNPSTPDEDRKFYRKLLGCSDS